MSILPIDDMHLITKPSSNLFSELLVLLSELRIRTCDHSSVREILWYYHFSAFIQTDYQRQLVLNCQLEELILVQKPVCAAGMSVSWPQLGWIQSLILDLFQQCAFLRYTRNCLFLNNLFFWWQAITMKHSKWVLIDRNKT